MQSVHVRKLNIQEGAGNVRMRGGAAVTAPCDQVHLHGTHIIEDRRRRKTVKYNGPKVALPTDGASKIMGFLK